jgi:serine/threonine protein kinase
VNFDERSTFERCALTSGLLTEQQLDEARAGVRWSDGDAPDPHAPPTTKQLADRLVEIGLLNVWQVQQLRDGRTKFNLGPYRIIDSIGLGGMGHVFKAQHEKLGIVAIKVLPRYKSTPEAVLSFAREIKAAETLKHPKLVTAIDAGQDGSIHYLVTEYVPGLDLRKWVRRDGPLTMAAVASIISQVAEALQYAHEKGIVHRDVKPGNVLVTPNGEAKLSDLGLAERLATDLVADSRQSKIVGTADYLSPDQVLKPGCPTPAWDIYSLGCTLYYAATGKVPFPGGTTADKARAHCDLRPLDPRRLNPDLTTEFVDLMADMMAKDPAQRIPSATAVVARLAPFQAGLPDMNSPNKSVRVIMRPQPPAKPSLVLAWPSVADTKTDVSISVPGRPDEESSSGPLEPFDLALLDEDVVLSSDTPTTKTRRPRTILQPANIFLFGIAISAVLFFLWILHKLGS